MSLLGCAGAPRKLSRACLTPRSTPPPLPPPPWAEWAEKNAKDKKLALVFASNDKSEGEFTQYFGEMSFDLALPFGDTSISKLGNALKVQGIPTLVILDKSGEVITADGRTGVSTDASGATFPWRPPTVESLLGGVPSLTNAQGEAVPLDAVLSKKYLALYFSAHWCPPCRGFTPKAAAWYKTFKAGPSPYAAQTEVVFVSSDKDEASFKEYLGEMPWPALPLSHKDVKTALSKKFDVQGIPTMVLLVKNDSGAFELEVPDLRSKIESDPDNFPWPPTPCQSLDDVVDAVNEFPTVIAFVDKLTDEAASHAVEAAMDEVAGEYFVGGKLSDAIRFAVAGEDDDATDQVRQFVGAAKDKDGPKAVRITLVDVQKQGKAVVHAPESDALPTAADIRAFVQKYLAGDVQVTSFREGGGGHGHSHAAGEACSH